MNKKKYELGAVLIAEDHELFSDGLKLLMDNLILKTEILSCLNFTKTLETLKTRPEIELLLLDLKLPETQGLDGIREIKKSFPTLIIVVISSLDFDINIRQVIEIGANGFIAKSTPKDEIEEAIKQILDGELVIKSEKKGNEYYFLSDRQLETLSLLAQGKSNKEIAKNLEITPHTAKEYVSKVISRLSAKNRTQAVLHAQKAGLLFENN